MNLIFLGPTSFFSATGYRFNTLKWLPELDFTRTSAAQNHDH